MTADEERSLSLAEWLVLSLGGEEPRHGVAIARILDREGRLGQIWRVPKPVIYRSLQRLEQLGLVRTGEQQPSSQGPVRSLVYATEAGRNAATRDVRSELLVKLALLDRAGTDPQPLLEAQREQLVPVAEALHDRLAAAGGFDRTLALWRFETVSATVRFLDALSAQVTARAPTR